MHYVRAGSSPVQGTKRDRRVKYLFCPFLFPFNSLLYLRIRATTGSKKAVRTCFPSNMSFSGKILLGSDNRNASNSFFESHFTSAPTTRLLPTYFTQIYFLYSPQSSYVNNQPNQINVIDHKTILFKTSLTFIHDISE